MSSRPLRLRARLAPAVAAAWALSLAGAAAAHADVFGPIALQSVGSLAGGAPQQAEYAADATVSADGRYVAFDGSVGGATGVWRRDLATGAIEQVAGGSSELPSISAEGRFISFTTDQGRRLPSLTDGLPAGAPGEAVNVYVRDMGLEPQQEGAFIAVSAPSGSSEPLEYSGAGIRAGASAAGRTAISADGREVVFVTTAISNLLEPGAPPATPAFQVAVRDIAGRQTRLVSSNLETGGAVSTSLEGGKTIGAAWYGPAPAFGPPAPYGDWGGAPPPGASISADGSTVAWMGANLAQQVEMLPGEARAPTYTEPLWRRIAPGSETPTERVTGGSDPTAPGCQASGEAALPAVTQQSAADPCQGPFVVSEGGTTRSGGTWPDEGGTVSEHGDYVPRLSADGWEVAFLSAALPVADGENFNASRQEGEEADLYVSDMHPGVQRTTALRTVTALAGASSAATTEPILEFAISPDGTQVAFTTRRTIFPLSAPALISAPLAEPGLSELYDADLADDTLTRVTHGYEGGPSFQPHIRTSEEDGYGAGPEGIQAGAESPSFSADGKLLAFGSTASNLVYGDGNTPPAGPRDGGDVFTVVRETPQPLPTPQAISPAPPPPPTEPEWTLGATAIARRDGSVLLYVQVPGPGAVRALARSTVPAKGTSARRARRSRLVTRTVAAAGARAGAGEGELVTLVLRPGRSYAGLASSRAGLPATISLSFSAPGHPTLSERLETAFRVRGARQARRHGRSKAARKHGRPR